MQTTGQPLEVVLAKPQAERKHDPSSYSYGAAPNPAPFVHPTFGGFAAAPYGAMGAGLGIAGSFSQVYMFLRKSCLSSLSSLISHFFVCNVWCLILH